MTKGRKTTFEERVEIVQYCISHTHNYAETAEKYGISYQQARNYTIKYEKDGICLLYTSMCYYLCCNGYRQDTCYFIFKV